MSKIIKLEDGQLVAEDPDSGERVPVSFETLEAEAVTTERVNSIRIVGLDQNEVQDAIDEVGEEGGGLVWITETGEADFDEVTITHDNVEVWGMGADTVLKGGADNYHIGIVGEENDYVKNCAIRHLRCENGNVENIQLEWAEDCEVSHFWSGYAEGEHGDGVDLDDCFQCRMYQGVTYENGQSGVHVSNGSEKCVVDSIYSYRDGVYQSGHASAVDARDGGPHSFSNIYAIEPRNYAVRLQSPDGDRLTNCFAIGTYDDTASYHLRVNSKATINGFYSINHESADDEVIRFGSGSEGSKLVNSTVENPNGNLIRATERVGIFNNEFVGVPSNAEGVLLNDGDGSQVSNNYIEGSDRAIESRVFEAEISGNVITGPTEYGILVVGFDFDNNEQYFSPVVGNQISGGCEDAGIRVNRADACPVVGNSINDVTGLGVEDDGENNSYVANTTDSGLDISAESEDVGTIDV